MNNQSTTVNYLIPIQNLIPKVEIRMRQHLEQHHPDLRAALDHLLSSGGKRIRVAVTLLNGCMFGAQEELLITLAGAIELLHTATLVHDDLIDGALLRRGIATLNSTWSPAATVLTGDYIFARAAKLAAETDSIEIMKLFADTLMTIVNGEITQLFASRGLANRENYYQRIYAKTASMFELATTGSAILGSADELAVEQARSFGYHIGMAFQIVDDILDFTGEESTVGKPVASDLRQGLVTLPALFYYETHSDDPDFRAVLEGHYSDFLIERVVTKIRQSGAIQKSMSEASEFVDRGLEILARMPDSPERRSLEELTSFIVRRSL